MRVECLDWALQNGIDNGIWGGQDEVERRTVRRSRPRFAARSWLSARPGGRPSQRQIRIRMAVQPRSAGAGRGWFKPRAADSSTITAMKPSRKRDINWLLALHLLRVPRPTPRLRSSAQPHHADCQQGRSPPLRRVQGPQYRSQAGPHGLLLSSGFCGAALALIGRRYGWWSDLSADAPCCDAPVFNSNEEAGQR